MPATLLVSWTVSTRQTVSGNCWSKPLRCVVPAGGSWIHRVASTLLFNAGQQIGEIPACVEIDFAKGFARWNSLAGDETRMLDAAVRAGQ